MSIQKPTLDQVVGLPAVVALFFVIHRSGRIEELGLPALLLVLLNVLSCRNAFKEKILFVVFNMTFFFFLGGRTLTELAFPDVPLPYTFSKFDDRTAALTHVLVFTSLLSVRLAFSACFQPAAGTGRTPAAPLYLETVRRLSGTGACLVLPLTVTTLAERILFVAAHGYLANYTSWTSALPLVFLRVADLYEPLLLLYLATFPGRRPTAVHLFVYLLINSASLGYGQRNGFVLGLLFVIIYLAVRDVVAPGPKAWLSKKVQTAAALTIALLVPFLAAFSYTRVDAEVRAASLGELLVGFIAGQGDAVSNISYAIELKDAFPHGKLYSLGSAIAFFQSNVVARTFWDTPVYELATRELALNSHNFSWALAYLVNPINYERGFAFGSCYIAELWIDFGITAVVCGGLLYGALMARFVNGMTAGNPFMTAFCLAAAMQLVYAPRAQFIGFLSPFLSMMTVAVYLAIHFVARNPAKPSS